jgi:hypothetical protein
LRTEGGTVNMRNEEKERRNRRKKGERGYKEEERD